MSLLIFFIVLAVLVLSHEFGHFIVAKLSGIRVDEFGFGFPPRLFAFKKGETEYSFNLIPFGGFVKIFGEDENEEYEKASETERSRSLLAKSKIIQASVIVAGVLFNFLLAWFLISVSLTFGTKVSTTSLPERLHAENVILTITNVLPNSPADKAGIKNGDEIVFIATDTASLQNEDLTVEKAQEIISSSKDKNIFIGYKNLKANETITAIITPISGIVEDKGAIGVSLDTIGTLRLPFYRAVYEGGIIAIRLVKSMIIGLSHFFYGLFIGESSISSVSGPVGLVGIIGEAGRQGVSPLLNIVAIISINLAVLNMVPLPALDGGRFLFIIAEAVRGKPINKKFTNTVNAFGFLLLLGIMFIVTYSDIIKLIFEK